MANGILDDQLASLVADPDEEERRKQQLMMVRPPESYRDPSSGLMRRGDFIADQSAPARPPTSTVGTTPPTFAQMAGGQSQPQPSATLGTPPPPKVQLGIPQTAPQTPAFDPQKEYERMVAQGAPTPQAPAKDTRNGFVRALESFGVGLVGGYEPMANEWNREQVKADKANATALGNYNTQLGNLKGLVGEESTSDKNSAEAMKNRAEAVKDLNDPAAGKAEAYKPYTIPGNPNPVLGREMADGSIIGRDGNELPMNAVPFEKPANPSGSEDDAKYESIVQKQKLGQAVTPEERAFVGAYEQRKKQGMPIVSQATAGTTRIDRSYQYNQGVLDKISTPVRATAQRVGNLATSIGQSTPQADALVAPELLSIMAGGQGSGLRMNESEIARIVGGRSQWENLKAAAQHWSTNPETANSITADQRQQIKRLADAVQQKLTQKEAYIEDAEAQLAGSDDPNEHRRIVTDAKKKIDAVDNGAGASQDFGPAGGKPEGSTGKINGQPVVVRNGRIVSQ